MYPRSGRSLNDLSHHQKKTNFQSSRNGRGGNYENSASSANTYNYNKPPSYEEPINKPNSLYRQYYPTMPRNNPSNYPNTSCLNTFPQIPPLLPTPSNFTGMPQHYFHQQSLSGYNQIHFNQNRKIYRRNTYAQEYMHNNNPNHPKYQGTPSDSRNVTVEIVVKELASLYGFCTEMKALARIMNVNYSEIDKIIKKYPDTFSTSRGVSVDDLFVELFPRISLCPYHLGPNVCNGNCLLIHICDNYLKKGCKDPNCLFGHNLNTSHNKKIIRAFHLTELSFHQLKELLQKIFKTTPVPKICSSYNQNNCNEDGDCDELHICYSYVNNLGKCSNGISCEYSHKINDKKCTNVIKSFGISLNESPRDLIKLLRDNCLDIQQECTSNDKKKGQKQSKVKEDKNANAKDSGKSLERKANNEDRDGSRKTPQPSTSHMWGLNGNVEKSSVCADFLANKCASKKCNYFHSKYPYHWQFRQLSNWYNFHIYHVQILEKNYKNVDCDDFILPKLNPKYVKKEMNQLFSLLGTKAITVNFKMMTVDCEGPGNVYSIRHLTTDSSVVSNDKHSTVFCWYFRDDQGKWELYGESESSSQEIEKYFLKDPNNKCKIKSATNNFPYEIDFLNMTQRNLTTGKVRPLKRRPKPVSLFDEETVETKFGTPKYWSSPVDSNKFVSLVPLSSFSDEFKEIRQIFKLTLPMSEIVSILRIQNTHLWKIFQNKLQELEQKYKDDFLNIQKLFHGIDPAHLNDICEKNLDYRLHDDPKVQKPYGNGTYFYNSAGAAAQHSKADFMGEKKLLVAEVIIGKITTGKSGMGRPPPLENDNSLLYDTTVDDVSNPAVFSKYNTQEYYPSYIVQFK